MRSLIVIFVVLLTACGYAPHKDPPLRVYDNPVLQNYAAQQEADLMHGMRSIVTCCGSMLPLIQDGDVVVVVPVPFDDSLIGKVVSYRPVWAKGGNIVHRLVSGSAHDGFIASGDNNPRSEANERVTKENFNGVIVGIYRIKL